EPVEQLLDNQINAVIQHFIEFPDITFGFNAQTGQVNISKAKVAAAAGHFQVGVIDVAHDTGTAAQIGHFAVIVSGLVILQVKGSVQEAEIGEQPLGGNPDGQLEQVIVGVVGIVVDAFLYLEDLHRENGGFPVAQTGFGGQ